MSQTISCFSDSESLLFWKTKKNAIIPHKATPDAAGYDLCSTVCYNLMGGECIALDTGIKVSFPPGTYGRVAARSGLALQNKIIIGGNMKQTLTNNIVLF